VMRGSLFIRSHLADLGAVGVYTASRTSVQRPAQQRIREKPDLAGPEPAARCRPPYRRPADARPGRRGVRQPRLRRIVIHSYRHRLGLAAGHPAYASLEGRSRTLPPITVPAVTLDGLVDGNFPATDGSASAAHFTGPRVHHHIRAPGTTFLRKHRRRSPRPPPRCSPSPHSRRRRHREPCLPPP
jgi:hypothetical protein